MVRQDIISGLRNAMERGQSLEQARQTLLNSGYNSQDVLEAINYLTGGLSAQPFQYVNQQKLQSYQPQIYSQNKQVQTSPQITQNKSYLQNNKTSQMQQDIQIQQVQQAQQMQQNMQIQQNSLAQVQPLQYVTPQKQKSKFPWGLFILSLVLLTLVGVLVASLLFKEEIIAFLETLLG